MGKRSDYERRPSDFYPTPFKAFAPVVPFLIKDHGYAEPCGGDGQLAHLLCGAGFSVRVVSDKEPRSPSVSKFDALSITEALCMQAGVTCFITNPPWPHPRAGGEPTLQILKHLAILRPTWLLLPADFMHAVYAAEVMRRCAYVVSIGRVKWIEGTKHEGMDNCCWYMFDMRRVSHTRFYARQPSSGVSS